MKKRILSMIMVLVMLMTGIAPGVFANDDLASVQEVFQESAPQEAPVQETPSFPEVVQDFNNAEKQAAEAAAVAVVEGEAVIALEETLAVVNEQLAETHVEIAETIDEKAQEKLEDLAEDAQKQQEIAEEAAETAEKDADRAEFDAKAASANEHVSDKAAETAENTASVFEAAKAADIAEKAAEAADAFADDAARAARDAVINANEANAAADQAQKDYEEAQQIYEETLADVERQLALGLIDAKIAEELTEAAKIQAEEKYEAAKQAREDAEIANSEQAAAVEGAKETLKTELETLDDIIKDNAVEVAKDTAAAVVTGAALEASKLALEVANNVVDKYQAEYDELKPQVDELDEAVNRLEKEILIAETELSILKLSKGGPIRDVDEDYQKALNELEAAKAALAEAQRIKGVTEDIIKELSAERDAKEYRARMQDIQELVKKGWSSQSNVDELTEIIFANLPDFGISDTIKDIAPVDGQNGVYSATAVIGGKETTVFFKAEVENRGNFLSKNNIVQYYRAEEKTEAMELGKGDLDSYLTAQNFQSEQTTDLIVKGKDGVTIKAVSDGKGGFVLKAVADGTPYAIQYSKYSGYYYIDAKSKTVKIKITDPNHKTYVKAESGVVTVESDELSKSLNIINKDNDLTLAQINFNTEWGEYNRLVNTIDTKTEELELKKSDPQNLRGQLEKLDKKLNGNLGARIITALINENGPEFVEMVATGKIDQEKLISMVGDSKDAILTELKGENLRSILEGTGDAWDQTQNLINTIGGVTDGDIKLDDVGAVLELISGDVMPLKMKQSIIKTIKGLAEVEYGKAKDKLETAVKKAEEEIVAQGHVVEDAGKALAKEELKYLETQADLAKATLEEAAAKKLEDKAKDAAEAAQKAYDELVELKKNPVDDSKVKEAEAAYNAAKEAAEKADKEAKKALLNAKVARIKAVKAAKNADYARACYNALLAYYYKTSFFKNTPDIDFDALREINPDIIGWIIIPGTNIDYPIVQGEDNEYYVDHLFEGYENGAGCIFMDVACNADFSGANSVLYGNNYEGIMFSDLVKFLDPAFLNAHREAQIITPDKEFTVELNSAKTLELGDTSFTQPTGGRTLTLATLTEDGAQRVIVTGAVK